MRIHVLRHVPYETEDLIGLWAEDKEHVSTHTDFHSGGVLPGLDDFDWLVVMGGPMSALDQAEHPWLKEEKAFIRQAVDKGKTVLGICLGAQLTALALGGDVRKNPEPEIGWLPINMTAEAAAHPVLSTLPQSFTPFHWHGETFDIPPGAVRMAGSQGCANQAFAYKDRVIGLQFHVETSRRTINGLLEQFGPKLVPGKYVQSPAEIREGDWRVAGTRTILTRLLDGMAAVFRP